MTDDCSRRATQGSEFNLHGCHFERSEIPFSFIGGFLHSAGATVEMTMCARLNRHPQGTEEALANVLPDEVGLLVNKQRSGRIGLAVIAAILLALPFLAGALAMGWQAAMLPESAGRLMLARLLGAALFCFGFAIALVSSVVALSVKARDRRTLATAGLLLGCSHIALGFVVRRTIEDATMNTTSSLMPVMLPIVLWAASIWLAVASTRTTVKTAEDDSSKESTIGDQQELLPAP
jgi:hypothetical protein